MSDILSGNYINLATWRKNGKRVNTPVWFAADTDTDCIYLFSAGNAGKVKRLRNNKRAAIASCDVTGKLLGPWHDAEGTLINDGEAINRAKKALLKKYGWQCRMIDTFSSLSGKMKKRQYIAIKLLHKNG